MVRAHLRKLRTVAQSIALAAVLGTLAASASAQDQKSEGAPAPSRGSADVSPEVAQKAASIARQTMSPFCPGRTLDDCPSEYATEWRRDIREMVEKGMTASEIQDVLEKRAGGNLSGIPNRESSYALPIVFATGAALLLYFIFVRLRRRDDDEGAGRSGKKGSKKKGPPGKDTPKGPTVDDDRLARELENED